jgi:formylglycine-generating enzyme required for sulfatase activity
LDQIAWWSGNSQSETHPVAQKQANDLGLFDMLGNVWEWCADHWHDDYRGAPTDGSAWMDDDGDAAAYRVLRGGSWIDDARFVRAACRLGYHPALRLVVVGFRCVRVHTSDRRGAAAPGDRGDAQQAERRAAARSIGDAAAVRLTPEKPAASVELPLVGRLRIISDSAELEFAQIGRPVWASAMGCDQFGLFAEFKIDDVIQRLRWMPPGRFMMGSPEDEKGRFSSEGPRHEVTFGSGFWMMDTPVRQCLWQAATGDNPSKFQGPERPVESVDWNMTQEFLSRLNSRIAGLNLTLPSEAQWEYACRAGGDAAAYSEDLGQIAWYSENSKKQTHPVGQKLANAYGLYDMLGNVWEWCEDHWRDSYKNAPTDGSAWRGKKAAADRVLRGGSWFYVARDVRAACRLVYPPASRVDFVGFRCVRVHS